MIVLIISEKFWFVSTAFLAKDTSELGTVSMGKRIDISGATFTLSTRAFRKLYKNRLSYILLEHFGPSNRNRPGGRKTGGRRVVLIRTPL